MKIGISMDAYRMSTDPVTAVKKLSECGFDALDFNFSDYCFEGSPLAGNGWKEFIVQIKNICDHLGMVISQIHSPFYMIIDDNKNKGFEDMMTLRSFEACSMLGSKWAVIHSKSFKEGMNRDNYEKTKLFNIERVRKLCGQAKEFGIGIALENIFSFNDELVNNGVNQTSDIIQTVDESGCDNLGVCLDTGHAFYDSINPAEAARDYNQRLKVLHVHDNSGKSDQHVAPFVGRINWAEFMKALHEIKYNGVFSLEIHNYVQRMPKELIDDAVLMSYKIAKHLVEKM